MPAAHVVSDFMQHRMVQVHHADAAHAVSPVAKLGYQRGIARRLVPLVILKRKAKPDVSVISGVNKHADNVSAKRLTLVCDLSPFTARHDVTALVDKFVQKN